MPRYLAIPEFEEDLPRGAGLYGCRLEGAGLPLSVERAAGALAQDEAGEDPADIEERLAPVPEESLAPSPHRHGERPEVAGHEQLESFKDRCLAAVVGAHKNRRLWIQVQPDLAQTSELAQLDVPERDASGRASRQHCCWRCCRSCSWL